MTSEVAKEILERLEALQRDMNDMRRRFVEQSPFEHLAADAVVGKDYVAWRFGCSVRAVKCGERGINKIPRVSNKPLKFLKRNVDAAWVKANKPAAEKAAEFKQAARPIRRKSSAS